MPRIIYWQRMQRLVGGGWYLLKMALEQRMTAIDISLCFVGDVVRASEDVKLPPSPRVGVAVAMTKKLHVPFSFN